MEALQTKGPVIIRFGSIPFHQSVPKYSVAALFFLSLSTTEHESVEGCRVHLTTNHVESECPSRPTVGLALT